MITLLACAVHHRLCYCPVTHKTVEVRIRDVETIKEDEQVSGRIRILSRTLEDCSAISECGIIRAVDGGSFIVDWQECFLNSSLQAGYQVWNSRPTSPRLSSTL